MLPRQAGAIAPPQPAHREQHGQNKSGHFGHRAGACHRVNGSRIGGTARGMRAGIRRHDSRKCSTQ
jgi:hypothetical protein